ncbi:MAG TPA: helix-turn-helix domain-containing protein [Dehalococcoidia bacterium]|jgi:transcriptional regulator with XRE-family HTH domain|nr:helix-turn-helix domain-containing protein [Dehalococcoidia bacterium]
MVDEEQILDLETQKVEQPSEPQLTLRRVDTNEKKWWWPWSGQEPSESFMARKNHFLTLAEETSESLKKARENLGLTLADVESQTFVNGQFLDTIEKGQWERLPARVYAQGAALSYATAVGLENPAQHAQNISNVLRVPDHLNPSIGLMKKSSKQLNTFRLEIVILIGIIALLIGVSIWMQNIGIISGLFDNTENETKILTSSVLTLGSKYVPHARALRP